MMERLTKRTAANGIILTGIFTSATYDTPEEVRQLLADYEDTGLTPEVIKSALNEDAIIKLCAQALGFSADRLRELAAADRDGRVVVLPCPFYSEVYALSQVGKEIVHGELRSTNKDYCLIVNLEGNLTSKGKTWQGVQVRMQDVFLTRTEAEAALKEQEAQK